VSVFFTSDLHFGHRHVAELRGFPVVAEHDAVLVENWQRCIRKHDTIWVLGDLAVSAPTAALELIAELPGTKHLIAGNHDRCHPMHRDAHNWQRRYLEVFDSVQPFARRRIAGRQVMLSHFPFSGDHTFEDRYTQYRLRDEGAWLLHGHTHSMSKGEGRQIHVGADAWGMAPVSLEVIENMVWAAR
jgi:calcineurin-like phosphoesterase family protein